MSDSSAVTESILDEYDAAKQDCADLAVRTDGLIRDLLRAAKIRTHSITHRVKERPSLERKLALAEGKYTTLSEVVDVIGLRVITYFPDEVDAVAAIIEQEFEIDRENSGDRRASIDPDRFGYISFHYVATHKGTRQRLPEWAAIATRRFEIQVRSILQHAWAEIEHDLGYKTTGGIPRPVRRRFSRLAGLLEIADEEFAKLRDDITAYQSLVEKDVIKSPEATAIDLESLAAFIRRSPVARALDRSIAKAMGRSLRAVINRSYLARQVERLVALRITTIEELEQRLLGGSELMIKFAEAWASRDSERESAPRGICVFYLALTAVASAEEAEREPLWPKLFAWNPLTADTHHDRAEQLIKRLRQDAG